MRSKKYQRKCKRKELLISSIEKRMKRNKEISKLKEKEKLDFKIGQLKSRIFNCEKDLEKFGENVFISNKLSIMKTQLEELQNVDKEER